MIDVVTVSLPALDSEVAVPIGVAVIAAVAAVASPVVTAVVQRRVQRQNKADHDDVQRLAQQVHDRLGDVADAVDRIDRRVDGQYGSLTQDMRRIEAQIVDHVEWEMRQKHMTPAEVDHAIDHAISARLLANMPHEGDTPS